MKKETPAQHPVDAFFREQEAKIPVTFDPAHWDALQAMLEQASAGGPPAPGAHVSDLVIPAAKPSLARFITLAVVFIFLAAVPAANPAIRLAHQNNHAEQPYSPERGKNNAVPGLLSTGQVERQPEQKQAMPTRNDEPAFRWSFLSAPAEMTPFDADTVRHQPTFPATAPLDSLYRQTDSLSIRKGLRTAQDSMAEQRKKKKHLFW